MVFHVTVRRKNERLYHRIRCQPVDMLRGEAMQPVQPVGAADPQDAAV
jgi:hypothetical protein